VQSEFNLGIETGPGQLYRYAWGNNAKRATLKGRTCRLLATLRMNSIVIQFTDNDQVEVTSRNAIRKVS